MKPDQKISWGSSLLIVVLTNFFIIILQSIRSADFNVGNFWLDTAIGSAIAAVFNLLRPKYEQAGRFWKPIYRFLLEQMSPPD